MLVRCNACRGKKKVIKLGFTEHDCSTCNGSGVVCELSDEASEAVLIEENNESKKGRKDARRKTA